MTAHATAQPTKADYDAATQHLLTDVFAPYFFQKLAAHGVYARTQDQQLQLLEMGETLLDQYQEELAKEAQAHTSLIDRGYQQLFKTSGQTSDSAIDAEVTRILAARPETAKQASVFAAGNLQMLNA